MDLVRKEHLEQLWPFLAVCTSRLCLLKPFFFTKLFLQNSHLNRFSSSVVKDWADFVCCIAQSALFSFSPSSPPPSSSSMSSSFSSSPSASFSSYFSSESLLWSLQSLSSWTDDSSLCSGVEGDFRFVTSAPFDEKYRSVLGFFSDPYTHKKKKSIVDYWTKSMNVIQ